MTSSKRFTNRIAALATAPLPPEMLVPELLIALQEAIGCDAVLPSVLVHDPGVRPLHEFIVWRGSENNTDALRALLKAGIWPAPSTIPSLQRLLGERLARSVFAAPLWGEGCEEDGPWGPLWRERDIRHGYYLAAFAPSGRACVALMSRAPASPPFSAQDVALGEATAPWVAHALDRRPTQPLPCDTVVAEIPVTFGADDRLSSIGVNGPEMLRDLGGGGPDAVPAARAVVEGAAARFRAHLQAERASDAALAVVPPRNVGGPDAEAAFRLSNFELMRDRRARTPSTYELGESAQGAFDLRVTASNDLQTGGLQVLGSLRRRVPRLLALVRGLVASDAPGREMQLAMHVCQGATLPEAAQALGISAASAKTLHARLATRFDTRGRDRVIDEIVRLGRGALR